MQFRDYAENLFGSKVKVKILRHILLQEEPEIITSERELAKLVGVSHSAVNKTLKDFYELNFVTPLRVGNVTVWKMNKENFAYPLILAWIVFSPTDRLKNEVKESLEKVTSIKKVVIYGSIVTGSELPNSDIDLFILVDKEGHKKDILPKLSDLTNRCIGLFGNKISPNIFTEKDVKSKRNEKFLENVSKGIVVFER
ncbi:MAG: nucleotidyltransferase domain-containing protein [Candidatus Aenigmarchaeota archaeon]|nr:nucleotidyltransferase domain-containing protein [Candidatus Aenigmarchaeota archaeon]